MEKSIITTGKTIDEAIAVAVYEFLQITVSFYGHFTFSSFRNMVIYYHFS